MPMNTIATPAPALRRVVGSLSLLSPRYPRPSILAAIASTVLLVTSAHASVPVVDGAWHGVWELDFLETECESGAVTADYMGVEHLCGGQPPRLSGAESFLDYTCTGEVTSTTIDVECTGSQEVFPGCVVDYGYGLHATRNGNAVTGFETYWREGVGSTCGGPASECYVADFTGVRLLDREPDCTATPTEATSWSGIKGLYR